MEIRIHFYLLCNYSQNYHLIKIPTHKNSNNILSFQTLQLFVVAIYRVSQEECARHRESVPYVNLYPTNAPDPFNPASYKCTIWVRCGHLNAPHSHA